MGVFDVWSKNALTIARMCVCCVCAFVLVCVCTAWELTDATGDDQRLSTMPAAWHWELVPCDGLCAGTGNLLR